MQRPMLAHESLRLCGPVLGTERYRSARFSHYLIGVIVCIQLCGRRQRGTMNYRKAHYLCVFFEFETCQEAFVADRP